MSSECIRKSGFAIIPDVLPPARIAQLAEGLSAALRHRTRAGVRHALSIPAVAEIASDERMLALVRATLGPGAAPIRATLFDKSPTSNWLVAWHQDTALPLVERKEVDGWGPWSVKDGVNYAHAPASALSQVLALRLHLDDSATDNGPLRVLPATHTLGVLTDAEIERLAQERASQECTVGAGGVIAMRPLTVHASSKSKSENPRRVLHIEYASSLSFPGGLRLAAV